MPTLVPDSFLAFDEANSYLDKQQRSLNYFNRIKILSVVDKTSIDLKNTNGYNRAAYINKLNHLSKLPTTSIVLAESAIKEHVAKPISLAEFKDLADELNNDDDSMRVSVESQVGLLIVEPQSQAEAMRKLIRKFWEQGHTINGDWKVPIVSGQNAKFVNIGMSIGESNNVANAQDEDLYEQVKKATNDPEYEKQIDNKIEKAYANKLRSGAMSDDENTPNSDNIWKSEDFTICPDITDDTDKQIEIAKSLTRELIGQNNTAKFVATKEEKDEE